MRMTGVEALVLGIMISALLYLAFVAGVATCRRVDVRSVGQTGGITAERFEDGLPKPPPVYP